MNDVCISLTDSTGRQIVGFCSTSHDDQRFVHDEVKRRRKAPTTQSEHCGCNVDDDDDDPRDEMEKWSGSFEWKSKGLSVKICRNDDDARRRRRCIRCNAVILSISKWINQISLLAEWVSDCLGKVLWLWEEWRRDKWAEEETLPRQRNLDWASSIRDPKQNALVNTNPSHTWAKYIWQENFLSSPSGVCFSTLTT